MFFNEASAKTMLLREEKNMFRIKCEKSQSDNLKEEFIKVFSEMCLSGIDYYREDRSEMNQAVEAALEIIDGVYCGFEDTEDGFIVEHDSVYEIGTALAEEFFEQSSFTDLFTNDNVGATGKWIVEQLHDKYPGVEIEGTIEYDDGQNDSYEEHVIIQDGMVISHWDDEE